MISTDLPAIDPTQNVLDLVEAAIRRQDDLRDADRLRQQEVADLRWKYDNELRKAETARIDAIRAVDVGAVQRAAEVALTQASTLATQVATSAETLRGQVAAAATAQATALASALVPLQESIADLRRAQYEAQGSKTQVVETRAGAGESRLNVGMIVGIAGVLLAMVGVGCSGLVIATTIVVALTR